MPAWKHARDSRPLRAQRDSLGSRGRTVRQGFEPWVPFKGYNALAKRRFRPLSHLTNCGALISGGSRVLARKNPILRRLFRGSEGKGAKEDEESKGMGGCGMADGRCCGFEFEGKKNHGLRRFHGLQKSARPRPIREIRAPRGFKILANLGRAERPRASGRPFLGRHCEAG